MKLEILLHLKRIKKSLIQNQKDIIILKARNQNMKRFVCI